MKTLKDAFNIASIKHPVAEFSVDAFWNAFLIRGRASRVMNDAAQEGYSEDIAMALLAMEFDRSRKSDRFISRWVGAFWMLPGAGIVNLAFMAAGTAMFVRSFEKIPFTNIDNKFAAAGLDPSKDYERAERIVKKHYHKRFK